MSNHKLKLVVGQRPLVALTGRFLIPRRQLRQALKLFGFKVVSSPRWGSVLIVGKDAGSAELAAKAKSVPRYTLVGFIVALLFKRVSA
jgi:hypothetical protein